MNKLPITAAEYRQFLEKSSYSKNTIKAYLSVVYTYYNIYKEANQSCLSEYKMYLEKHYCPRSANLHIIGLNRYLSFIGKSDLKLPTIKVSQKSFCDDIISYREYQKLKRLLKDEEDQKWYYLVWTLAATGVRISELVRLRYEDVQAGHVDIRSKGNKVRRIFFPKQLQRQLLCWIEKQADTEGPLFRNDKGAAISIRGITKGLERAAARYGIDKHLMHPHAFRHLFAKKFLESKSDLCMLADLLGHESLDTTKIYLRMSSSEQQQIIDDIVVW